MSKFSVAELTMYFEYLDELRESGQTNMFGCGPYLQKEFNLPRDDARTVALAWMKTFGEGVLPPEDRADQAMGDE